MVTKRSPRESLRSIGFWTSSPDEVPHDGLVWPGDWVDWTWDPTERARVLEYLEAGFLFASYRGCSSCRLCHNPYNGIADIEDGVYLWPSGFAHYVEKHGVKPPADFVAHVLARQTVRAPASL